MLSFYATLPRLNGVKSSIKVHIINFFKNDSGQATTEYILVLAFAVVIATTLSRRLLDVMDRGILNLGGVLERDLKTGKAPLNVWSN